MSQDGGAAVGADSAGAGARVDDPLHALGGRAGGPVLRGLRAAAAVVGAGARELLGEHLGVLRGALLAPLRAGAGLAHDAGRAVVRGRVSELRGEHADAGARSECDGGAARLRAAYRPTRPADVGRALRAGGRGGRRAARAGRGAGRSGGGVHAEHPRDADRLPGHRERGRDLLERGAGVRGAQRDRPLRPDRAEGAARGGRLPPRRQGLRPPRGRGGDPRGAAHACATRCSCPTCSRARRPRRLLDPSPPRLRRPRRPSPPRAPPARAGWRC